MDTLFQIFPLIFGCQIFLGFGFRKSNINNVKRYCPFSCNIHQKRPCRCDHVGVRLTCSCDHVAVRLTCSCDHVAVKLTLYKTNLSPLKLGVKFLHVVLLWVLKFVSNFDRMDTNSKCFGKCLTMFFYRG
jgi:hypothetical protein